jgi:hypothetical protein
VDIGWCYRRKRTLTNGRGYVHPKDPFHFLPRPVLLFRVLFDEFVDCLSNSPDFCVLPFCLFFGLYWVNATAN